MWSMNEFYLLSTHFEIIFAGSCHNVELCTLRLTPIDHINPYNIVCSAGHSLLPNILFIETFFVPVILKDSNL